MIELGTNGEFTKDQMNELIDSLGEADIYLIKVRVPRDYESTNNKIMEQVAKKHKMFILLIGIKHLRVILSILHMMVFTWNTVVLKHYLMKSLKNERS